MPKIFKENIALLIRLKYIFFEFLDAPRCGISDNVEKNLHIISILPNLNDGTNDFLKYARRIYKKLATPKFNKSYPY